MAGRDCPVISIEQTYRNAMRWYPKRWRAENEDAVVGTLLDVAEGESRERPRGAELVDLAVNGLFTRARTLPSFVPASVRDRASTAALAVGSAIALAAVIQLESDPNRFIPAFGRDYTTFGAFASPSIVLYAAWLVSLLAAVAGFAGVARWGAAATIPIAIGTRFVADAGEFMLRPTWTFCALLIMLALIVIAGRPARAPSGVRWLVAWFSSSAAVFVVAPALVRPDQWIAYHDPLWLDQRSVLWWSPVVIVAAAIALCLIRRRAWAAAVTIVGLPFAAVAIVGGSGMFPLGGYAFREALPLSLLVAAVLVIGATLIRVAGFRVRLERVSVDRTD